MYDRKDFLYGKFKNKEERDNERNNLEGCVLELTQEFTDGRRFACGPRAGAKRELIHEKSPDPKRREGLSRRLPASWESIS
jgi:hypothetical protein